MRKSRILGLLFGSLFCIANADPSNTATTTTSDQAPKVIMVKSAGNSTPKQTHASTTSSTKKHKAVHKHNKTQSKTSANSSHSHKKPKTAHGKSKPRKKTKSQQYK